MYATPLLLLGISDTVSSSIRLCPADSLPHLPLCSVWCGVVSVSVCVELIVSSLYCLHSVYAILILSIPICKNVLSFVLRCLTAVEPRGHGLHYRVLLGQAVRLCVFSVITNMQVECVLRLLAASRNSSKELKE